MEPNQTRLAFKQTALWFLEGSGPLWNLLCSSQPRLKFEYEEADAVKKKAPNWLIELTEMRKKSKTDPRKGMSWHEKERNTDAMLKEKQGCFGFEGFDEILDCDDQ